VKIILLEIFYIASMSVKTSILVVIPARGGSKGIPRKNIRLLNGKPLISYGIKNALNSKHSLDVVVTTDDEEIERISKMYGAKIVNRPKELADDKTTLDPVIYHALKEMEREKKYDIVITMQPTSPLLTSETLDKAIDYFLENDFDSVISVVNRPHLSWTEKEGKIIKNYAERLNRQFLPKNLLETGAFFISRRKVVTENSRLGENVSIYEVQEKESIDVDSPQDWWICEKELSKKNILIRVDGYKEIGMGHIYRGLVLANNFIDHNIVFILSKKSDIGINRIKDSYFQFEIIENNFEIEKHIRKYSANIVINDILNTEERYIKFLKSLNIRVINYEDLGDGARFSDAVINDLYDKQNDYKNFYWGSDYYIIRDEFLLSKPSNFNETVKEILVLFGGTDPCNLTRKIYNITDEFKNINFKFILGMGYPHLGDIEEKDNVSVIQNVKLMTEYMKTADIAISSNGRTMLELASMAVPTILLSQNTREETHEFGSIKNGFLNLGLGKEINDKTIKETISFLVNTPQIRKQMKEEMLKTDLKNGIKRVRKIIFEE